MKKKNTKCGIFIYISMSVCTHERCCVIYSYNSPCPLIAQLWIALFAQCWEFSYFSGPIERRVSCSYATCYEVVKLHSSLGRSCLLSFFLQTQSIMCSLEWLWISPAGFLPSCCSLTAEICQQSLLWVSAFWGDFLGELDIGIKIQAKFCHGWSLFSMIIYHFAAYLYTM